MFCSISGADEEPTGYNWSLNGTPLVEGNDYSMSKGSFRFAAQTATLTIKSCPAADTTYTCEAVFSNGDKLTQSSTLDIVGKFFR